MIPYNTSSSFVGPGATILVDLNQYELVELQSGGDSTGIKIQSNRPVAVFTGNLQSIQHAGHLMEQLPPTSYLANRYYAVS